MNPDWLMGLVGGLLIGLASMILLLGNGRIAGISGIFSGLLQVRRDGEGLERLAFIAGLIAAPVLYSLLVAKPEIGVAASWPLVITGGLLVGIGTRLGSGCTSGHGVCGMSRLSIRSIVATLVFMATAIVVVAVMGA